MKLRTGLQRLLTQLHHFVLLLDRRFSRDGRPRPVWLEKYGPPTRTENRLIVENLSSGVSWQDLKDHMRKVIHMSIESGTRMNEMYYILVLNA